MLNIYAAAALLLAAAPAPAANHYHAAPVVAPTASKIVLKDTIWNCAETGCVAAAKSASRPAIVCASFVKKAGAVQSFSVAGTPLSPAELEKCNARAD